MFDINHFKRQVKNWIQNHPNRCEQDLIDFCEELIPPNQFAANQWIVEQTLSWYRHILTCRERESEAEWDNND